MSDEQFANVAERFPLHPPVTKEYYMLREMFEEHFVTGKPNGQGLKCFPIVSAQPKLPLCAATPSDTVSAALTSS